MTDQQVNPTPKSRFQAEDLNIKAHHNLLQMSEFQRAEDMALLSYQRSLAYDLAMSANAQAGPNANPQVMGMINGWKLAGVQEFLAEFHHLAEKPVVASPPGQARTLSKN